MGRLIMLLAILGLPGCARWEPWNDLALPSGATVEQHEVLSAGFDESAVFRIRYDDELTIHAVVSAYNLTRCTSESEEPASFVALRPPFWWKVANIDEKYARTDRERERYWSLWVDRKSKLLFVETGNW